MGLLRLFSGLSRALGGKRDLIRRVGGLCLLFMGVHAAADFLDDITYRMLDSIDLLVDESVAAFLAWVASAGGLSPDGAARAIDGFSTWIDLAQKDWLAIRLAFVVELLVDVLLFDLAWGTRLEAGGSVWADLKASTNEMRAAFTSIDLERLVGPPALALLATGGALLAARAVEGPVRSALETTSPELLMAGNLAAALALLSAALLLWRFLPDLLHGALVRAHERGEAARTRIAERSQKHPPRHPRLRQHADEFRRAVRGWWLLFALVLAGAGVVGHDALNLLERLQAPPPEVDLVLPLPTTTTTTTTTPPSTVRDGGVP